MSVAEYLIGDVFDVLASMPDASVDLVLTSPPFLALRSYLPADHPDKHKEIGSEPTPAEFLDTLLALTAEWGRVLAPHGSICVELGDTYSGSTSTGGPPMLGDPAHPKRWDRETASDQVRKGDGWPCCNDDRLLWAAAVAEVAEDRGQTDG
jgi:DNA modification methylase